MLFPGLFVCLLVLFKTYFYRDKLSVKSRVFTVFTRSPFRPSVSFCCGVQIGHHATVFLHLEDFSIISSRIFAQYFFAGFFVRNRIYRGNFPIRFIPFIDISNDLFYWNQTISLMTSILAMFSTDFSSSFIYCFSCLFLISISLSFVFFYKRLAVKYFFIIVKLEIGENLLLLFIYSTRIFSGISFLLSICFFIPWGRRHYWITFIRPFSWHRTFTIHFCMHQPKKTGGIILRSKICTSNRTTCTLRRFFGIIVVFSAIRLCEKALIHQEN